MGEDMSEFLIRELGRQPDRQQDPRPDHAEEGWAADGVRPFKGRPPPASSSLCAFIPHRENARAYACRPCPAMRGLRNLAIALIRRCGWPGIPTGHRHDAAPPGDAQRDRRLTTARHRSQAPRPRPAQRRPAVRRMCALGSPRSGQYASASPRRPSPPPCPRPIIPAPTCSPLPSLPTLPWARVRDGGDGCRRGRAGALHGEPAGGRAGRGARPGGCLPPPDRASAAGATAGMSTLARQFRVEFRRGAGRPCTGRWTSRATSSRGCFGAGRPWRWRPWPRGGGILPTPARPPGAECPSGRGRACWARSLWRTVPRSARA